MKEKENVNSVVGKDLYSIQIYSTDYFKVFNPSTLFEKWAGAEVNNFDLVPAGFETTILPGGLYAVFLHKGPAAQGPVSFRHIFQTWLPQSDYLVDNRPHYEVMTDKYKQNSEDSEEELFVPVKAK